MTLGEVGILYLLILAVGVFIGMCIGPTHTFRSGYSGTENPPKDAVPPRDSGVPMPTPQTISVIVRKDSNE